MDHNVDFIKIETQGSELDILKGSTRVLDKSLGLKIEVEFLELYKSQATFGDIVEFLAKLEFGFVAFTNLNRWSREQFDCTRQCVWGDALFLKTPEKVLESTIELSKISSYLGCLLLYNRFDLILQLINLLSSAQRESLSYFID